MAACSKAAAMNDVLALAKASSPCCLIESDKAWVRVCSRFLVSRPEVRTAQKFGPQRPTIPAPRSPATQERDRNEKGQTSGVARFDENR